MLRYILPTSVGTVACLDLTDRINDRINDKIIRKRNQFDNELLGALKDNAYMTMPELAEKLKKSESTVQRHLNYLIDAGIVARIGSRKSGYWKVSELPEQ